MGRGTLQISSLGAGVPDSMGRGKINFNISCVMVHKPDTGTRRSPKGSLPAQGFPGRQENAGGNLATSQLEKRGALTGTGDRPAWNWAQKAGSD